MKYSIGYLEKSDDKRKLKNLSDVSNKQEAVTKLISIMEFNSNFISGQVSWTEDDETHVIDIIKRKYNDKTK